MKGLIRTISEHGHLTRAAVRAALKDLNALKSIDIV